MSLSKFCIQHKVATLLAVIMISVFGVIFTTQLQLALMPDLEAPMAMVVCYYNGANPSDIEELVTRPLESAVMSVSGVDSVSSTSADSMCQLQVTYVDGTDLDIAATKLREQFDRVSLPEDAMDPVIVNLNLSELMPTAMVALTGEDLSVLQTLADNTVAPALERIDGVAQVTVSGGVTQRIAVEVDPARAAGLGLSNSYVSQFLAGQNLLYPGGDMQNGSKTLTVSTDAKFQSVEDVGNMLLSLPTGGAVRLREVADVTLETEATDAFAEVDGTACVVLQVSKQSGANEAAVADAVAAKLAELHEKNTAVAYTTPYLASEYINLSVDAALQNILQGVLLAAVVVFLFLRRGSATMTIAVSMPVCILAVFVLMNAMDLTLNMMTLGGVAMGVGMIVDNSIVVLENIYRFAAEGKDRLTACVEGTREVTTSVVASTLTTEAVFVPLGFVSGIAGMMFRDFALTIASLIFASLAIALTLVPLLCYLMLDEEKIRRQQLKRAEKRPNALAARAGRWIERLYRFYLRLLDYFVHHLKTGMLAALGLVAAMALPVFASNLVMMPDMDQGQVSISVSMPIGSQADESAAIASRITAIAQREVPELEEIYYIAQDESVTMMLNLVSKGERSRSCFEITDSLRPCLQDIAGCEITVSASSSMGMVSGEDINETTMRP